MVGTKGFISREQSTNYQRWQAPNIEQPNTVNRPPPMFAPPRREEKPSPPPEEELELEPLLTLPTVEQIESITQEAYQEGFDRGYREGLARGEDDIRHQAAELQLQAEEVRAEAQTRVAEAQEQAKTQVAEVQTEAEARIAEAQAQAETQVAEAQAQLDETRTQLQQEFAERGARLDEIIQTLEQPLLDLDQEVQDQLVTLALAVARQIVYRELRTQPEEIITVVREALAALPSSQRDLHLHLHPEDAPLVRSAVTLGNEERSLRINEDSTLTRGGCRIASEVSRIDATVEERLNRAIARLLGAE